MTDMLKCKLTSETRNHCGRTLYRIQALIDFSNIDAGDFGGWIEIESNLNQEGDCWVFDNARVYDNAQVFGDARVFDNALVYGNAQVFGDAQVLGDEQVYDNANVLDNTKVFDNAKVFGASK